MAYSVQENSFNISCHCCASGKAVEREGKSEDLPEKIT
jgi:hypothetical protein